MVTYGGMIPFLMKLSVSGWQTNFIMMYKNKQ